MPLLFFRLASAAGIDDPVLGLAHRFELVIPSQCLIYKNRILSFSSFIITAAFSTETPPK